MSNTVLKLQKVTKIFGGKGDVPLVEIFNGMDFSVKTNEVVGLFSPSGSGKTTFLQIAGLLDSKFSGDIYINGSIVDAKNDFQTSSIRRKNIGFVFQFHHLLPEFTALENVSMPALIAGESIDKASKRAIELLDRFGIADRKHHRPSQLSGGEQQRVAIARAFITSPKILFADEPTGNLDAKNSEKIEQLLFDLNKDKGTTLVLVTHDNTLAQHCSRQLTMSAGELVETTSRTAEQRVEAN